MKTRTKTTAEDNGGICRGKNFEEKKCNTKPCPGRIVLLFHFISSAACFSISISDCLLIDFQPSYTLIVDCIWGEWSTFGSCSESCGGGTQKKTRTKTTVEDNGGICSGKDFEAEKCNTEPCPSKIVLLFSFCFF